MELDEAIRHCLERANQDCSECANEHRQLADWLTELKCRRANMSVDDMDEFTVQYAYHYGEWQRKEGYKFGYEAGYKAGLKKGKSIGSHQAYNHFVKHRRWIYDGSTSIGDYFKCSSCNAHIFLNKLWKVSYKHVSDEYRYCHWCGAKMVEDCDEKV